jgi:hypothetical protein
MESLLSISPAAPQYGNLLPMNQFLLTDAGLEKIAHRWLREWQVKASTGRPGGRPSFLLRVHMSRSTRTPGNEREGNVRFTTPCSRLFRFVTRGMRAMRTRSQCGTGRSQDVKRMNRLWE